MPYFQQGDLYLSSGPRPGHPNQGWSSVSYNAHHNSTNDNWAPFPDPARPAVTIEIDNANGYPRAAVFTAAPPLHTNDAPNWILVCDISSGDGVGATVVVPGFLDVRGGMVLYASGATPSNNVLQVIGNVDFMNGDLTIDSGNLHVKGAAGTGAGYFLGDLHVGEGPALATGYFTGDLHVGYLPGIGGNGFFQGDLKVHGQIQSLWPGADCAEDFDVRDPESAIPGTLMVLCDDETLAPSAQAYDKRVVGVVSGAGDYQPAMVLDRHEQRGHRVPVALMGKVYCRADAQYAPIEVGDLLTTSATPGHAMKASDQARAYGAIVGKALQPMATGNGLLLILVTLQ